FLIQGVCGFLATAAALSWSWGQPGNKIHRTRTVVLLLALATVVVGWPLERKVSQLRDERNAAADVVLRSAEPVPEDLRATAADKRAEFGPRHAYSLFLNFGTLLLVTCAMALAARLPQGGPAPNLTPSEPAPEPAHAHS